MTREAEKMKRKQREWEAINLKVKWDDADSYMKDLAKRNDNIKFVGEDIALFCFIAPLTFNSLWHFNFSYS